MIQCSLHVSGIACSGRIRNLESSDPDHSTKQSWNGTKYLMLVSEVRDSTYLLWRLRFRTSHPGRKTSWNSLESWIWCGLAMEMERVPIGVDVHIVGYDCKI
ncbi:hypothetical protein EZV62_005818 [Acer yangbiense]|uniref:Uncharacterized protein n=1 Tax=Acer yangbiense TaxID=1000413 RepID=A0A5C7INF5_9ROSI|nr:hypothetical protein EZV62_005818 [Acer yangbiense]